MFEIALESFFSILRIRDVADRVGDGYNRLLQLRV